jgi:molecular chaperone DnaK (HSP70)
VSKELIAVAQNWASHDPDLKTKKQVEELKEKISSPDKENIVDLISKLRSAINTESYDQIKSLSKSLQDSLMEVGKKVYSTTPNSSNDSKASADSVIDADFSETK